MENQLDLNRIKSVLPNREAYILDLLIELGIVRNEIATLTEYIKTLKAEIIESSKKEKKDNI